MSEQKKETLFRQRLELLLLTERDDILSHARGVISQYLFTFRHYKNGDLNFPVVERELKRPSLVLVAQNSGELFNEFLVRASSLLSEFPLSQFIAVIDAPSISENLDTLSSPRMLPLTPQEYFDTLKFETFCLLKCRSQFHAIEVNDLFPGTLIDFTGYVRLSLNQKYLAVLFRDTELTEQRLQRLGRAPGLLVPLSESKAYHDYVLTYYDSSGAALKKRSRSLFFYTATLWVDLLEYLWLDLNTASTENISNKVDLLRKVSQDFVEHLKSEENLWDTFKDCPMSEFFKYWRGPWVATYAATISLKSGVGNPTTSFFIALLAQVGLLDLPKNFCQKYLATGDKNLNEKEQTAFESLPMASLNRCLVKHLPLTDEEKSILVTVYEQNDGQGFPHKVPADKIPPEAALIRFAEKIDLGVRTTLADTGVGFRFLREKTWEHEKQTTTIFGTEFLEKIANSLL